MAMSEELVLLDSWASPFVARVKIALKEKGITNYKTKHEDLLNAKSPLLLEMNPVRKKVPVLIHSGKPVCESLIILEYIDQVWTNEPCLFPVDPYQRAQARFWANCNEKWFLDFTRKIWTEKGEIKQEDKKRFINCLKLLEVELGDKPYYGGETFGYLDIALIPIYSWFYTYEKCVGLTIVDECPKLITWAKRCMERNSVKESLPNELDIYRYALERKNLENEKRK